MPETAKPDQFDTDKGKPMSPPTREGTNLRIPEAEF